MGLIKLAFSGITHNLSDGITGGGGGRGSGYNRLLPQNPFFNLLNLLIKHVYVICIWYIRVEEILRATQLCDDWHSCLRFYDADYGSDSLLRQSQSQSSLFSVLKHGKWYHPLQYLHWHPFIERLVVERPAVQQAVKALRTPRPLNVGTYDDCWHYPVARLHSASFPFPALDLVRVDSVALSGYFPLVMMYSQVC